MARRWLILKSGAPAEVRQEPRFTTDRRDAATQRPAYRKVS
jgi:hypothetical protein